MRYMKLTNKRGVFFGLVASGRLSIRLWCNWLIVAKRNGLNTLDNR